MTELWMGFALLLLLAALFLGFPGWFLRAQQHRTVRDANLDWFANRRRELDAEEDATVLLEDAQLRILEDGVDTLSDSAPGSGHWRAWLFMLPLALLALALYQQLGAAADVRLSDSLQALGQDASRDEIAQLMGAVAHRAQQRPDNLHYQAMLGRYYMDLQDYQRARQQYLSLVERAPEDSTALAMAAQASYMAARRVLDPATEKLAQQALAVNPHERSALGLLGMASFDRQQYRAAIGYWRRLLVMEDPASASGQMIASVIQRAEAALGGTAAPAAAVAAAAPTDAAALTAGISVRVQLPAGSAVPADNVVFIFARDPNSGSRMPVAVKRFTAGQLPLSLRLDDAASMAGQKISVLPQVVVVARVSPDGQPGEEYASWQGQIGPLAPGSSPEEHVLTLAPNPAQKKI